LLKAGKHTITALTRKESKGTVPEGIKAVQVDYDDDASVVAALKGQQFLIITLSVRAPPDLHGKIVAAAVKAGVTYVMPNAYGFDITNDIMATETGFGKASRAIITGTQAAGASTFSVVCGFWLVRFRYLERKEDEN
jgi:saccharopine dehydrogenase-like NADP-dependent oxidoreductase